MLITPPIQVLFVEDQEDTRIAVTLALRSRGFAVLSADSAETVRAVMAQHGPTLAVAIFDMVLIEPRPWGVNGAQLAVELRERYGARKVEILAWSAFQEFGYMSSAMRARAAAYLSKGEHDAPDIVRHVRVLAIRWLLREAMENPATGARTLVSMAHGESGLLKEYARRIIVPAMERCLGAPFAVVMVDGTKVVGSWGELSEAFRCGEEAGRTLLSDPGVPRAWNDAGTTHATASLLRRGSVRLVLTMRQVRRDQGTNVTAESVEPLAFLVSQFLPDVIHDGLTQAVRADEELRAVRTAANLTALAQAGIQAARQLFPGSDKHPANAAGLRALDALASRLRRDTDALQDLAWELDAEEDPPRNTVPAPFLACAELVRDALAKVSLPAHDIQSSITGGERLIAVGRGDAAWGVSTLLQWFVDRSRRTPDQRCTLRFDCRERGGLVDIIVEDESERAPEPVRQMLFEPGMVSVTAVRGGEEAAANEHEIEHGDDLALYVARAILDWRHRCEVHDETDRRIGERGHRFVLSFPQGLVGRAN